jgi:hypothetical protein
MKLIVMAQWRRSHWPHRCGEPQEALAKMTVAELP